MTAETSWTVKRAGFGVSTSIGIGGDALIGTTIADLLVLFEDDPETEVVVTFSEPGTTLEEEAAEMLKSGKFTKPLVSFVAGRFTESLPEETVFGHAGALISGESGRPSVKIKVLKEAGARVVECFDELVDVLRSLL